MGGQRRRSWLVCRQRANGRQNRIIRTLIRIIRTLIRIVRTLIRIIRTLVRIIRTLIRIIRTRTRIVRTLVRIVRTRTRIIRTLIRIPAPGRSRAIGSVRSDGGNGVPRQPTPTRWGSASAVVYMRYQ